MATADIAGHSWPLRRPHDLSGHVVSRRQVVEYILSGACPCCGHQMSATAGVAGVLDEQAVKTVRCNCSEDSHAGRPDGKTGCGQRGNIPIP